MRRGSGFVVSLAGFDHPVLMTALHLVAGANMITYQFTETGGQKTRATVVAIDKDNDIAILGLQSFEAFDRVPLELASDLPAREDRGDRRWSGLQRGGLPGAADRPRSARLAARDRGRRAPGRAAGGARLQPVGASIAAIDDAESVLLIGADPLKVMPILDLRLRRAVRHHQLRLVIASERPTALDGGAEETARYAPGDGAAFLAALAAQLGPDESPRTPGGEAEGVAGRYSADAERLAGELRPGRTLVIWGERLGRGPGGEAALNSLRHCVVELHCDAPGGGVISVPAGANARGIREVGCLPDADPGFGTTEAGSGLDEIKAGLASGELDGVILLHADPIRELPDGRGGRGPSTRPARSSPSPQSRTPPPGRRTSSSRPRSTPRRRAPSPTPTAACSGCVPRPRPGRPPPSGRSSRSSAPPSATRPAIDSGPRGARGDRVRGPVLRRPDGRGDRRHRDPLAGPRCGDFLEVARGRTNHAAGTDVPTAGGDADCDSGPTETCGPTR